MSMSRLVVAFGGEIVREWDITGKPTSIRRQYDDLKDLVRLSHIGIAPGKSRPFFEFVGSWGPKGKPQRLLIRVADIKGLDLQEGIEDPVSE